MLFYKDICLWILSIMLRNVLRMIYVFWDMFIKWCSEICFYGLYEKLSFHGMFEKSLWRTWCYLSIRVWKHEAWGWLYIKRLRSLICLHSKSKGSRNCLHNESIGAEVASIVNNMNQSCLLLWWSALYEFMKNFDDFDEIFRASRINMPMSLNGKEHMSISID
jgi:hypothetical protein